jgi:hypothetical protein
MSYKDAETLLSKAAYSDTAPDDRFQREGRKVVETLGCLALAIV